MQYLLTTPPNLAKSFCNLLDVDPSQWFATSDPPEQRLGSGGGTTFLVRQWRDYRSGNADAINDKRIIIHAGGESRRIPSYATTGKILTPIPIFRWTQGQCIDQNLLSLQLPLYRRIMSKAPGSLRTLIASGDVYIRAEKPLQAIPEADVVCYGLWVDPELASHHGVFVSKRETPDRLEYMLQKPSAKTLESISSDHYFLMDVGVWLLSDRAMEMLEELSSNPDGSLHPYDLYSQFGGALGETPTVSDSPANALSVAILPLPGGEFYHYGTSRELLSSTTRLQDKVLDQRKIYQPVIKPNTGLFVQNCIIDYPLSTSELKNVWVENSCIPASWQIGGNNIFTGIPSNNWKLSVPNGICLDIEPVGEVGMALRPYGYNDTFSGKISDKETLYLGIPLEKWLADRDLSIESVGNENTDIQQAKLFAVLSGTDELEHVAKWMISNPDDIEARNIWLKSPKISASEITACTNLKRLFEQRRQFFKESIRRMAANHERSVFYQLDLANLAANITTLGIEMPDALDGRHTLDKRLHNLALRSVVARRNNNLAQAAEEEAEAFTLMRKAILSESAPHASHPHISTYSDQIVWGRSPLRIDVAGGWTDTPPYSLLNGGTVVNLAIDLNGQTPIQAFAKCSKEPHIILRSIDMGAMETITTYEQLADFKKVGSPFSIPKAALALAGFLPQFSAEKHSTLREALEAFGSGIELTLLSAVPAGSGLGTSSILAATVLGTVSDFCSLDWSHSQICRYTLALEQMLTTGGGWQDQWGGVFKGVKLLDSDASVLQNPSINWLPDHIFTAPEYSHCHLLYYTGITRTAKHILDDIVRGMFLNSGPHLSMLETMRLQALDMARVIQHADFQRYGEMVLETWKQNTTLDKGSSTPDIEHIIRQISDYCIGYKLPGAGGGGFLYMVAKDQDAASRIKSTLMNNAPNNRARFVDMTVSNNGLSVSRS